MNCCSITNFLTFVLWKLVLDHVFDAIFWKILCLYRKMETMQFHCTWIGIPANLECLQVKMTSRTCLKAVTLEKIIVITQNDKDFFPHLLFIDWLLIYSSSLPPVNSIPNYSQKKWEQLQSSWNILGVKPIDYSTYQKQN